MMTINYIILYLYKIQFLIIWAINAKFISFSQKLPNYRIVLCDLQYIFFIRVWNCINWSSTWSINYPQVLMEHQRNIALNFASHELIMAGKKSPHVKGLWNLTCATFLSSEKEPRNFAWEGSCNKKRHHNRVKVPFSFFLLTQKRDKKNFFFLRSFAGTIYSWNYLHNHVDPFFVIKCVRTHRSAIVFFFG